MAQNVKRVLSEASQHIPTVNATAGEPILLERLTFKSLRIDVQGGGDFDLELSNNPDDNDAWFKFATNLTGEHFFYTEEIANPPLPACIVAMRIFATTAGAGTVAELAGHDPRP